MLLLFNCPIGREGGGGGLWSGPGCADAVVVKDLALLPVRDVWMAVEPEKQFPCVYFNYLLRVRNLKLSSLCFNKLDFSLNFTEKEHSFRMQLLFGCLQ